ncbi:sulfotransferase family protein [Nonomuraea sp. FMUSA5-5]|uniref:Sulfotransferase family protein n=1 Tax=Nonomuraea composti TaxID=2720023 RepID=A0ABX1BEA3_9ACTN|nr:sulfotransferase family protein [Nonomuraea sp. FMUSA5-5]NJP95996.1 sulfotransferase family protein [Nonomuraea sp. FMUSA5-5]
MGHVDVIGAGLPRTGTTSMKAALEHLGFGPCHHMQEIARHPEQGDRWSEVLTNRPSGWEEVLGGHRSAVDWPSAFLWRELVLAFPAAKAVLTVRSPATWYASMRSTVFELIRNPALTRGMPGAESIVSLSRHLWSAVFGHGSDVVLPTEREATEVFERHTAEVLSSVSSDRVLVHDATQGWEPLCEFLGVKVPSIPYPALNRGHAAQEAVEQLRRGERPSLPGGDPLPGGDGPAYA